MRLPSDQRARVSRSLVLRAALGARARGADDRADRRCGQGRAGRSRRLRLQGRRPPDLHRRRRRRLRHRLLGRLARRRRLLGDARHAASIRPCCRPRTPTARARTCPPGGTKQHGLPHLGHALPRDRSRARARSTPPASTGACRCAARARSASTASACAGTARSATSARSRGTSGSSSSSPSPARRRPPPPAPPRDRLPTTDATTVHVRGS